MLRLAVKFAEDVTLLTLKRVFFPLLQHPASRGAFLDQPLYPENSVFSSTPAGCVGEGLISQASDPMVR
jgi:hypothetical protein